MCFTHTNPSARDIIATSIGPPTVSIPLETRFLIEVEFTRASAILAISDFGMNSIKFSISEREFVRMTWNASSLSPDMKAFQVNLRWSLAASIPMTRKHAVAFPRHDLPGFCWKLPAL